MGIAANAKSLQSCRMGRILIVMAALMLSACGQSEVEDAVSRDMLDPAAVQFRNLERCSGDQKVWHGEANSKNAYGAYVGFKRFYYAQGDAVFSDDLDRHEQFMELLGRCDSDLVPINDKKADPVDGKLFKN